MNGFRALLLGNLVGKLVGVAREVLLAATFGTGPAAAAYRIAQTATLTPINFFTADALSAGFLPEHAQRLAHDRAKASHYYQVVSRVLILVSILLAVSLIFFRATWVSLLAPGLAGGVIGLATNMLGIMAIGVPFYVSTALGSYLAISHGRYKLAAARPTVQSFGLIAGTVSAFALDRPALLAVGFTGAYVALAIWTALEVRRIGHRTRPVLDRHIMRRDLMVFWWRLRPMLIAPLFLQGSWAVERSVATLIGLESVAAIDYARLITDTVVVMIAAPLGLSLLVPLSRMNSEDARSDIRKLMSEFMAVFVPVSSILAASSVPIVVLLFERGEFDGASTEATATILRGLSLGLFAMGLATVLLKALNARQLNRQAALGLVVGCTAMIAFDLLTYDYLGPLALGLGAALSGLVQTIWFASALGCARELARSAFINSPHFAVALVSIAIASEQGASSYLPPLIAMGGSAAWILAVAPLRRSTIDAFRRLRP